MEPKKISNVKSYSSPRRLKVFVGKAEVSYVNWREPKDIPHNSCRYKYSYNLKSDNRPYFKFFVETANDIIEAKEKMDKKIAEENSHWSSRKIKLINISQRGYSKYE